LDDRDSARVPFERREALGQRIFSTGLLVFILSENQVSFVTPQPNDRNTIRLGGVSGCSAANAFQPSDGRKDRASFTPVALRIERRGKVMAKPLAQGAGIESIFAGLMTA